MTCICWWDGGETTSDEDIRGGLFIVREVLSSHTHTAKFQPRYERLLLRNDHRDFRAISSKPSIPDQCQLAARTWKESHPIYGEERDTGKQYPTVRWQRSPKGKILCPCDCTKSHRNPTRPSCPGSSRRTSAGRTWGYRRPSKNRSSYTSTQPDLP